jgi:hypothetical protein
MNGFGLLQALVFEPKKAFAEIESKPRVFFPLLLLIIGTAGLTFWYYQVVDLAWMTDHQLRAGGSARRLTEEQIATLARAAGEHPGAAGAVSAVVVALVLPLIYALMAVYYLLAGKITNVQRSFRQWFSFTCWTSMPSLLGVIVGIVVLLTATSTQISDSELRALSLNSLLFHKAQGEPGFAALSYIGLPELLSMYLAVFGVRAWSGRSWLFSAVFALLPAALIAAIVALFVMGRS